MLKRVIGVSWPKKISNEALYTKTSTERWSIKIKRRRLNWLGHVLRMDEETPARRALEEAMRPAKRRVGKKNTILLNHF